MNRQISPAVPTLGYGSQMGSRKRRRKALSCYECRRRKVKCDRGTPACNRCKETGQANSCSYTLDPQLHANDEDASESPDESLSSHHRPLNSSSTVPDEILAIVKQQAARIAQLEDKVAGSDTRQTREWKGLEQVVAGPRVSIAESSMSKMQIYIQEQERKEPETIPMRGGRGFETKFYGASNATSLISYFPELRKFIEEALQHNSSLARIQRGLHIFDAQRKGAKTQLTVSDARLLDLLPRKEVLDLLVKLYFKNFETTFRVLHRPSFLEEYNMFWQETSTSSAAFMAILLLLAAIVSCLSTSELSKLVKGYSSREIWVDWVEACEEWLGFQSQKHLTLANFQIRCLLLLAKQMLMMKEKRAWTATTTLLSFSMSAGLHRDPSLLGGRISVFDQEMRRRLWGTIVELEIEASIDRGVRPFSADLPSDCPPPSNLEDDVFGMTTEQLPKENPSLKFTSASYLCKLHKSRSYRTTLISLINNPKSNLHYDEVMAHEGKLLQMIRELRRWENADISSGHLLTPRVLLDLQLQQLLLSLHSPWARQTESNPRYSYSRMVCLTASKHILDQHSTLAKSGSYALLILRHDVVRAALSFCHYFSISRTIQDDLSSTILGCNVFPLIGSALSILEEKVLRIERGYKNYIFVSAAYGLILSQDCPERSDEYKFETIERATRLYTRVLISSGELSDSALGPGQPSVVGSDGQTPSIPQYLMTNSLETMIPVEDLPFEQFDYGEISDWPLDDLWPQDFVTTDMGWL